MTNVLSVFEYQGQRVVTLAAIDQLHGRPKGAASRSFRHYRQHFVEGADYFVVGGASAVPGIRKGTPLFTKEGYLKVILPFNDDLSWRIHREVVTAYIRGREVPALPWGIGSQEGWAE